MHSGQRRQAGSCASASSIGEEPGSGHVFDRDPFRERNLGRSVGAGRGVLFIDGGQAVVGKAIRDTNEGGPQPTVDESDLPVDEACGDYIG